MSTVAVTVAAIGTYTNTRTCPPIVQVNVQVNVQVQLQERYMYKYINKYRYKYRYKYRNSAMKIEATNKESKAQRKKETLLASR